MANKEEFKKDFANTGRELGQSITGGLGGLLGGWVQKARFNWKLRQDIRIYKNRVRAYKKGMDYEDYVNYRYDTSSKRGMITGLSEAYGKIVLSILSFFILPLGWLWVALGWIIYVPLKFNSNIKVLGVDWVYDVIDRDSMGQKSSVLTYYRLPLNALLLDVNFTNFLNSKYSGKEQASILSTQLVDDDHYGKIRLLQLNNQYYRNKVKDLEAFEILNHFIIPQKSHEEGAVYYQVNSIVKQSAEAILEVISRDDFISLLKTDKEINFAFPEVKNTLKEQAEEEQKQKEKREEIILKMDLLTLLRSKNINDSVADLFIKIYKNRNLWNFNLWNANDNLAGNDSYVKVRCILLNNKSVQDVERLKHSIEADLRHTIMIQPRQDKGAFDLVILLEEELQSYKLKNSEIEKYNQKKEFYIGKSLTGNLSSAWNYQANHFLIGGMSGSGKSVQILNILQQLANISQYSDKYDYRMMFLTSSSKIGDFTEFSKAGALVASGIDKQIQVFRYVFKILEKREELFFSSGVANIEEYNKKVADDAKMGQIVLLADEWENTRQDLDSKKAKIAEGLLNGILNIARSSGCIVIVGAQSILKSSIGVIADKMTVKYSGYNRKNVLNTIDPSIADYYTTLDKKPQGVFFYDALNIKPQEDFLSFGNTSYTLIQTPYISDISAKTLGNLQGNELMDEIFVDDVKSEDVNNFIDSII